MRKRTRLLVSTSVLVIVIGAIFLAGKPRPSSAHDDGFKMYQLLVFCGDSGLASAIFGHVVTEGGTVGRPLMGTKSICVGKCGGDGTVLLADALAGLPAAVSADLQAKVDKHQADAADGNGSRLTCLGDGKEKPPEDKKPKCEPPRDRNNNPPWLNQGLACQNTQRGTYSWAPNRRDPTVDSVSISACGEVIRYVTTGHFEMTRLGVRSFDVCCDTWLNTWSLRSPCNARRDIDCDGTLNEEDLEPLLAPLKRGSSEDFVSNAPLTPTLPFWRQLYEGIPSQSDCTDCKWELVGVQYTCENKVERTGRRSERLNAEYKYQATWKCPASGQTKVTSDYATMKGSEQRRGSPCCRCPSPPSGSWP